jgi:hypothetical protein
MGMVKRKTSCTACPRNRRPKHWKNAHAFQLLFLQVMSACPCSCHC